VWVITKPTVQKSQPSFWFAHFIRFTGCPAYCLKKQLESILQYFKLEVCRQ